MAGQPPFAESAPSRFRREQLARTEFLDAAEAAEVLRHSSEADLTEHLRVQGSILGVLIDENGSFRYPKCQFANGEVVPQVAELLRLLPKGTGSGWRQVDWLYRPHAYLGSRRPADILSSDPQAVLAAAHREFEEGR